MSLKRVTEIRDNLAIIEQKLEMIAGSSPSATVFHAARDAIVHLHDAQDLLVDLAEALGAQAEAVSSGDGPPPTGQDFTAGWYVLELFGHGRATGYVTETRAGGSAFLQVRVPGETEPRHYGGGSVYAFQKVDEPTARAAARYNTLTLAGQTARALAMSERRQAEIEAQADTDDPDDGSDPAWAGESPF